MGDFDFELARGSFKGKCVIDAKKFKKLPSHMAHFSSPRTYAAARTQWELSPLSRAPY